MRMLSTIVVLALLLLGSNIAFADEDGLPYETDAVMDEGFQGGDAADNVDFLNDLELCGSIGAAPGPEGDPTLLGD